ncbi:MAG: hypothetical protein A2Y25_06865 [Candidatus Melainabacteria bacterium GWF2_37_15]|nr:MAG: hypothetical protein A2Y25_06865 [Candidatus Melainabacteria bacterium GWF2_37_15]
MIRIVLIIFLLVFSFSEAVFAAASDSEVYTISIPTYYIPNGIGSTDESSTNGLPNTTPDPEDFTFGRMVSGSYTGNQWELTTNKPIGLSLDYNLNAKFSITAEPFTLTNVDNGYTLVNNRTYPTQIIFNNGTNTSEVERLFRFYPIVKVDKNVPPGNYEGTITFTISQL